MPANVTPIAAGGPNVVADISFRLFTFSVDPVRAYAITDPTITPATEPPARMRFPENLVSGACLRILVAGYVLIVDPLAVDPFVANGVYLTDQHGVPSQCLRRLGDVTDAAVIAAVSGPRRFTSGRTYYLHWSANPLVVFAYMDELTARMRALGVAEGATATERASRADSVRGVLADFVSRPGFFRVTARQRPSMSINRGRTDFYDFVDADGQFGADHPTLRGALTMVELLLEQARVPRAAEASIWEHSDLDPLARTMSDAGRPFLYDPSGINRFVLAGRETIGVMELAEFADREVRRRLRNAAWGQTSLSAHSALSDAARAGQPLPSRHVQLREAIVRGYSVDPPGAAEGLARRHASWVLRVASAHRNQTSASEISRRSDAVAQLSFPDLHDTYCSPEVLLALEASLGTTRSELFQEIRGTHDTPYSTSRYLRRRLAAIEDEAVKIQSDIMAASKSYYQHYLFGLNFQSMDVPNLNSLSVCVPPMAFFINTGRVEMDQAISDLRATVRRLLARCPMHRVIAEAVLTSPAAAPDYEDILARYLNLTRQWTDDFAKVVPATEDPLLKKVVENVARPLAGISRILREHYRMAAETILWQMLEEIGGPRRPVQALHDRVAGHVAGVTSCMKWFGYVDTPSQLAFGVTAHAALAAGGVNLQPWIANHASPASRRQLSATLLGVMENRAAGGTTRLTQELAETVCKEASALATIRPLAAPAFAEEFVGFVGSAMAVAEFARQFEASERLGQRTLLVLKISKEIASAVSNLASAVRVVLMLRESSALHGALALEDGAVKLLRLARTSAGIAGKATKVAQRLGVAISAYEAGDLFLNPDSALSLAGQAGDAETYRLQATRGALLGTSAAVGLAGLTGVLALSWAGPIGVGIGVAILAVEWGISESETEYYSLRTQANEQFQYEYRYDPGGRTFVSGSVMQMKALGGVLRLWA